MTYHVGVRPRALLALLLAILAVTPSAAQTPEVPTFPTATEVVHVRFHVERKGTRVEDLKKEQLRVLEDGKPQEIVLLELPGQRDRTVLPEVTLVLDVSSSVMDEGLLDEALVRALLSSLHAESRVGLCAFGGRLECFTEPTTDAARVDDAFRSALRFGYESRRQGTRLYDSLRDLAVRALQGERRSQRAFIVFTDALDTEGGRMKDALEEANRADIRVYAVKLSRAFQDTARSNPFGGGAGNRAMYDYKKLEMDQLAAETGGRSYEPGKLDGKEMAKILQDIAAEIRTEIVVGYAPQGAATGRKRKVKVELADRSLGKIPDGERTLVR